MCVIPVVHINYLQESNSQNTFKYSYVIMLVNISEGIDLIKWYVVRNSSV
jgi:hypothetical protein